MDLKFGKLDNSFEVLEKNYQDNGEISWSTFTTSQKKYRYHTVLVVQDDFKDGTLRIREPCMIKLSENIYFNPNRPETWLNENSKITEHFSLATKLDPDRKLDWWPDFRKDSNKQYFEKEVRNAYRLGFFAAISIETQDVILNLNNYKIQQHPEHALQQRFFSIIELADQPFVPKQGPADFGKNLRSASNVLIKNGKMGLSSHHGIHGNNNNGVLIKNIDFTDNEVCSIALNGCTNVNLVNLTIVRNRHDIPVLGTYSAGRFLKLFINNLSDSISTSNDIFEESIIKLNQDLDKTFNSVIFNNEKVPDIYINKSGLIDGNYYGMIIHPIGVAVNAPLKNRNTPKANESAEVYVKSVSINNIKTQVNEILALRNTNNNILTAPSGGIFQFMKSHKLIDNKYYYQGNSLSNLQIELVQLLKDNTHIKKFLGNFNIDEGILAWKRNKNSYFTHKIENSWDYPKFVGHNELNGYDYEVIGNGDSMFHVNKGTFGFRIDGLNTSVIDNLSISNIEALGEEGSLLAGNYFKSHPKQNQLKGYRGHLVFGVEINASNDLQFKNLNISSISSKFGSSYGISISGESKKIQIENSQVEKIIACQIPYEYTKIIWPNLPTNARGLYLGENCDLSTKSLNMKDITDTPNCLLPSDCELYSIIKTL